MSGQLLASKVVIVEEEPRLRSLPALPTAVVGAVGVAERGPIGQAVLVTSFEEYVQTFGGFTPDSDLALAAQGFFENGGQTLWVARTVHYGDPADPATKTSAAALQWIVDRGPANAPTLAFDAKWDGTYANAIRILVADPTSGAPDEFNITVEANGLLVEAFPNLSLVPTRPNYVEAVINDPARGSRLVRATDLHTPTAAPNNLPALGAFGPLGVGDDGLAGLDDTDFAGSPAGRTGLHALDTVQDLSLLIVPGRATAAVHAAMVAYCETTRGGGCFAVLDPPANASATGIVAYVDVTAALRGLSEFAAIYWPRVKVLNPAKAVFGNVADVTVPPSGHIAGVYARTDAASPGGIYVPPAGIEAGKLLGVIGFETDETLDEAKRDLVFPKLVNPLTVFPGAPRHIDGARTLKDDGNFPTVAERRGVIFIEQTVKRGLAFARHKNNNEALRATLDRTVRAFLLAQLKVGAFASPDPDKAFFVDFGEALNSPAVVFARQVVGRVGLATNKPAEFIVLRFSQDTRALDAELAGGS